MRSGSLRSVLLEFIKHLIAQYVNIINQSLIEAVSRTIYELQGLSILHKTNF